MLVGFDLHLFNTIPNTSHHPTHHITQPITPPITPHITPSMHRQIYRPSHRGNAFFRPSPAILDHEPDLRLALDLCVNHAVATAPIPGVGKDAAQRHRRDPWRLRIRHVALSDAGKLEDQRYHVCLLAHELWSEATEDGDLPFHGAVVHRQSGHCH